MKVEVTFLNGGSSISTGAPVTTTGTSTLGGALDVSIGDFVRTCSF